MTDREKVRLLISDTDAAKQLFTDAQIDGFLELAGSVFGAAALACEALARRYMVEDEQMGDYRIDRSRAAQNLLAAAKRFREKEEETPAFACVEENLSPFSERDILRNYALRHEV